MLQKLISASLMGSALFLGAAVAAKNPTFTPLISRELPRLERFSQFSWGLMLAATSWRHTRVPTAGNTVFC
jgi:hypothetical protein